MVYNLRRDKFHDIRVRKALSMVFDFQWLNKNLFYNSYTRSTSYFNNSGMEATGIPSGAELALLEPYRQALPPELFTHPHQYSVTDGSGLLRDQMKEAMVLLKSAG